MLIEVTQKDIEEGEKAQCFRCPIALAIKRASGLVCQVEPDFVFFPATDKFIGLPDSARHFIDAFDRGKPVEGFSFNIEI